MLPTHLFKQALAGSCRALGYECRDVGRLFQQRFAAVRRADIGFLAIWEDLIKIDPAAAAICDRIKLDDPNHIFYKSKDALNAAILASPAALGHRRSGNDGNLPLGQVMAHAMHFKKPWKRSYVWDALNGFPPGRPTLPSGRRRRPDLALFGLARLFKRLDVGVARIVGRLHHRSLHY